MPGFEPSPFGPKVHAFFLLFSLIPAATMTWDSKAPLNKHVPWPAPQLLEQYRFDAISRGLLGNTNVLTPRVGPQPRTQTCGRWSRLGAVNKRRVEAGWGLRGWARKTGFIIFRAQCKI